LLTFRPTVLWGLFYFSSQLYIPDMTICTGFDINLYLDFSDEGG